MWWKKDNIPIDDKVFQEMIVKFVFECPAMINKKEYVSMRKNTFRSRGIEGGLLNTVNSLIKNLLPKKMYMALNVHGSVEDEVNNAIKNNSYNDKYIDIIVFHKSSNMSDTERVFYTLRNALAHGAFQVVKKDIGKIYFFENIHKGVIKGQIRLKEKTLLELLKISQYNKKDVLKIRKK